MALHSAAARRIEVTSGFARVSKNATSMNGSPASVVVESTGGTGEEGAVVLRQLCCTVTGSRRAVSQPRNSRSSARGKARRRLGDAEAMLRLSVSIVAVPTGSFLRRRSLGKPFNRNFPTSVYSCTGKMGCVQYRRKNKRGRAAAASRQALKRAGTWMSSFLSDW